MAAVALTLLHVWTNRLARHIVAMEKFRPIFVERRFRHRRYRGFCDASEQRLAATEQRQPVRFAAPRGADLDGVGALSRNKKQSLRTDHGTTQNNRRRFRQGN